LPSGRKADVHERLVVLPIQEALTEGRLPRRVRTVFGQGTSQSLTTSIKRFGRRVVQVFSFWVSQFMSRGGEAGMGHDMSTDQLGTLSQNDRVKQEIKEESE